MSLPFLVNPGTPAISDSAGQGYLEFNNLKQALLDILGLPASTNITGAMFAAGTNTDGSVATDTWIKGPTPFKRFTGTEASAKDFRIVESAGLLLVQVNTGTQGVPTWQTLFQIDGTTGLGTSDTALFTNRTGAGVVAGNAVVLDPANDTSVILDNTQGSLRQFLISLDTTAHGATGRFTKVGGQVTVTVEGAITRGNYLRKSVTTAALEDTGISPLANQAAPRGALAIAETGFAGPGPGTVKALLFGVTQQTSDDADVAYLTNKTGGTTAANDVAALGVANTSAVELADVQASIKVFVVASESVLNNASGRYTVQGRATVKVNGAVSLGNFLRKSATVLALEDSGVAMNGTNAPPAGSLGVALSAFAGPNLGTVTAYLWGVTLPQFATVGTSLVRGLVGANNAATPNTKYDLTSADFVQVRNPTTGAIRVVSTQGLLTNDITAAQAINGRDQAAAFTAGSWVHLYYVGTGSGSLVSMSSASPPPTGPTFLVGQTEWAYAGAVRLDGASALLKTFLAGSWARYQGQQTAFNALSGTTENTVSVSAFIPPNALVYDLSYNVVALATAETFNVRLVTAVDLFVWGPVGVSSAPSGQITLANRGQQFFFQTPSSTRTTRFDVVGYKIPNGDA